MPKYVWALIGMTPLVLFIAFLLIPGCNGRNTFMNKYNKSHSLEQLESIKVETNVVIRKFPNGEWVALIYEHDCCTGNGFVVNIFNDSTGSTYTNTDHNYCNIKATESEISDVKAINISEFYGNIGITLAH